MCIKIVTSYTCAPVSNIIRFKLIPPGPNSLPLLCTGIFNTSVIGQLSFFGFLN